VWSGDLSGDATGQAVVKPGPRSGCTENGNECQRRRKIRPGCFFFLFLFHCSATLFWSCSPRGVLFGRVRSLKPLRCAVAVLADVNDVRQREFVARGVRTRPNENTSRWKTTGEHSRRPFNPVVYCPRLLLVFNMIN